MSSLSHSDKPGDPTPAWPQKVNQFEPRPFGIPDPFAQPPLVGQFETRPFEPPAYYQSPAPKAPADIQAQTGPTERPERQGFELSELLKLGVGATPLPPAPPSGETSSPTLAISLTDSTQSAGIQCDRAGTATPTTAPPTKSPSAGSPSEVTNDSFQPHMIEVQGWSPTLSGTVTVDSSKDIVKLEAPIFTIEAQAALKPGLKIAAGSRIDVGPIQSTVRSERVAVYRKGGLETGDIVAEQHSVRGASRDAFGDLGKPGRDRKSATYAPAPWYLTPQAFNADTTSATVKLIDRPLFPAHKTIEGGALTETRGQDEFIAAVGAKPDGRNVSILKSYRWSVPWSMKIASGAGQGLQGAATTDAPPALTGGPTNTASGQEWIAFPSLAAAMAASPGLLMSNLAAVKANDPTSWGFSVEALKRKNPLFRLQITADKRASFWGKDQISVQAKGSKTATVAGLELNFAVPSTTVGFVLSEVFDVATIDGSSQLEIQVLPLGKTLSWKYPFSSHGSPQKMSGGDGDYSITGSFV